MRAEAAGTAPASRSAASARPSRAKTDASATAGQHRIDVASYAAERLPHALRLVVETESMVTRKRREQPAVELVTIARDARQEFGERKRGLKRSRAVPREARRHQDHAGEHGGRLPAPLGIEP
jgi:hypothetical protein